MGTVVALTTIAAYFPRYRRGGNPTHPRHGLLILPHFLEGLGSISLSFGQLVILSQKRLRLELRVILAMGNISVGPFYIHQLSDCTYELNSSHVYEMSTPGFRAKFTRPNPMLKNPPGP